MEGTVFRYRFLLLCFWTALLAGVSHAQPRATGLKFTDNKIKSQVDNAKPRKYGAGPAMKLPQTYDLSASMPPVGNQGAQGSCAGWATAYAMKTIHERAERNWAIVQNNALVKTHVFSPAFVYNQVNQGVDQGSSFVDIFKLMQEKGCATLSTTPYKDSDYRTQPSATALKEASNYKIAWAKDIDPKETGTIKSYISQGYPIIIGAQVDDAFMNLKPGSIVRSMSDGGGHAMVVVGYDDNKAGGCFKIMNSWGQEWGDKGFCWMTYEAFKKCVFEVWLVEDVKGGKSIEPPVTDDKKPYTPDKSDQTEDIVFEDEMAAYIILDSVTVEESYEGFETYGAGLVLSGFVDVDIDAGSEAEVIMYFTAVDDEDEGVPCDDEDFSDINGELITFTDSFTLDEWINEYEGSYEVYVPFSLFSAAGYDRVLAIPVLFVDGVDVAHGEPVEISGL